MTPDDLFLAKVAPLVALAERLNAYADEATARIHAIEQALTDAGVRASVAVAAWNGATVGYQRLDDRWQLVVASETDGVRSLVRSSRATRIQAAPYLGEVLDALRERMAQQLELAEGWRAKR